MYKNLTKREVKNKLRRTEKHTYNCGGYALETFDWYNPNPFCTFSILDFLKPLPDVEIMVNKILSDFKDCIRLISDLSELEESEYAIAFCSGSDDFHFFKKQGNKWYEKRGSSYYIQTQSEEYVLNGDWCCGRYNSKVYLFAKRRTTEE